MKRCLVAIMSASVLISCVRENIIPVESGNSAEPSVEVVDNYVYGEARVYLSEEMTAMVETAALSGSIITRSSEMNLAIEDLGITQMHRLFPHAGEYEERTRREGLHRWYVIKYSEEVALTRAQNSLEKIEGIEVFEPVRQIRINDFNDLSQDLWGLHNSSNAGFDINVRSVWNEYTTGNPDVIVAVVDSGIDITHEDLAANCLSSRHHNFVDGSSTIQPEDHGTHVAGTIAAVSNNGKGIAGIAGGDAAKGQKGVKLMSCQIFKTNSDGTTSNAGGAAAIKYGADNGAVISQNSWGYSFDTNGDGSITGDELTKAMNAKISSSDKAAVDYFIKYAGCDNNGNQLPNSPMKGGVVIFAAGNDALTNGAPAEYSEVIAVGSVARDGSKSTFSNYGDWVDICAPGSEILSTVPDNRYAIMSGTSMACPHVSGIAALIVSHFGGPGFTNEMLKEKILNSANTSAISKNYQIGGLVDTYGAFVYGNDKAPAPVTDLSVSASGNKIDLTMTVPADEDGKAAYGAMVYYSDDLAKLEAASATSYDKVGHAAFSFDSEAGKSVTLSLKGLEFEKKYYVKVQAYSYGRNYSEASEILSISTTANNAPVITTDYDGSYELTSSQQIVIPLQVIDPDGHDVRVEMNLGSDAEAYTATPEGGLRLTIKGKDAPPGTYTSQIVATDDYGLSSTLEIEYKIKDNSAPVKIKDIEDILLTAKGREFIIDMTEYASDPDAEQLKYEATISNPKVVHVTSKGDQLIGTALSYGSVDVTVVAKDARGEKVVFEFKVTVKDPSDPLSVYPNPVKDYLNVATLDMAETSINIYNSTGKLVYGTVEQVSATEPLQIDMRDYAPGTYSVQVAFGGKEYRKNVVKL